MAYENYPQYTTRAILDRLGLEYTESGQMNCPFCKKTDTKKKLHINFDKDVWRCPKCDEAGSGHHFFALYRLGRKISKYSSKNELREANDALREFMDGCAPASSKSRYTSRRETRVEIPRAPDAHLHEVYSVIAEIPQLQLLPQHKNNLLKRGLSEEVIIRNGYRSIPENMMVDPYFQELYQSLGGERLRLTRPYKKIQAKEIRFGLMIARFVLNKGLDVQGVPGFFKFGQQWCFRVIAGMLIPTRNPSGQIVVWQVRKDVLKNSKESRYLTVSAQEKPGHVTESVSRCHFPLGNAPMAKETPFLLTEGPLKADIACHLYGSPVTFAAMPGVSTARDDFLKYAPLYKKRGIQKIYDAFDMDKLTNSNVRNTSAPIKERLSKYRISFEPMYWGSAFAAKKLAALAMIAQARNVPYCQTGGNVFDQLRNVASALDSSSVMTCTYLNADSQEVTVYWDPETKGIDDYLLYRDTH